MRPRSTWSGPTPSHRNAKIVLEVAPTNSFADLYNSELDAVAHHRGVVISNSWSGFESGTSAGLRSAFDALLKEAIAIGIDVNFSTGDYGDNVILLGYADVGYPGELAVCNFDRWHQPGAHPEPDDEVPDRLGKQHHQADRWRDGRSDGSSAGRGVHLRRDGRQQQCLWQAGWQTGTNQPRRATPDVSWLADPYTGVEIVQTVSGTP